MNVRDWLYVDDHAEAIYTILRSGRAGETYNVGGDGEKANLEIIHLLIAHVAEHTGKSKAELEGLITYVKDRPGHDRRYAIDFDKIKNELGWKPRHDLQAGLASTTRWYLDNGTWIEHVRTGAYREWMNTNYDRR
jgi:dTDP-glucose 4,6-dehydratase